MYEAASTSSSDEIRNLLAEVQLEEFTDLIRNKLQVRCLSHFDAVEAEDLEEIGMSKPAIRRLLRAASEMPKSDANQQNHAPRFSSIAEQIIVKNRENKEFAKSLASVDHTHIIPSSNLTFRDNLGTGRFGYVRSALWRRSGKEEIVAVKVLKPHLANKDALNDFKKLAWFISETSKLRKLEHPNLVNFFGISFDNGAMLITELVQGTLSQYLHANKGKIAISKLSKFAEQLADALAYLENERCVHLDVALKNLLLAKEDAIKLGDVGLLRMLPTDNYKVTLKEAVHPAWAAPETLKNGEVSHASDTWMYGVTVWEIFSFGDQPWPNVSSSEIIQHTENRVRLVRPICCPVAIYQMLLQCWRSAPSDRPKFSAISHFLKRGYFLEVTAKKSFSQPPNDTTKLRLEKGDRIVVIESGSDKEWWYGQNKRSKEIGYFEQSKVKFADGQKISKDNVRGPLPGSFVYHSRSADMMEEVQPGQASSNNVNQSDFMLIKPTRLETRGGNSLGGQPPSTAEARRCSTPPVLPSPPIPSRSNLGQPPAYTPAEPEQPSTSGVKIINQYFQMSPTAGPVPPSAPLLTEQELANLAPRLYPHFADNSGYFKM